MQLMQSDIFGMVVWFVMLFVFFFFYPRLMLAQLIFKIEQSARKMEIMSEHANAMAARKINKRPHRELKQSVDNFTDIFVVEPSAIDPYGLVRKVDQTIRQMETRFDYFVDEVAKDKSYEEKQEINYGLRAAVGLRQISKMVRHFVEIAKKFKNLQIAMILQMQLPIIEKIAESELHGTEAFVNGWPIGDSIGPLVAASLIDKSKELAEDVYMGEKVIDGRRCFVLKANGPAPHLGRIDEAMEAVMKKHRIARVITIDAAQKLEGEKTGSVAEGIGFAMGGIGQRELIENVLLPKRIPIDSIVIKVGMAEAIEPMRKSIYHAVPKAVAAVEKAAGRAKRGEKVIVIGVGNSCGIGNSKKELDGLKDIVTELDKKIKEAEAQKKGGWF
ncbi:MAG: DUF1512 family protein [Candidatus Aenigmarchaeota archaeon]|nr:DUF1512 family protein [Candidatus Aenigmarchaeota archaeon]